MAIAVTTVASGGLPVTDVTATHTRLGLHVAETAKGLAITKGPGGLPVNFAPVQDWPGGGGGGTTYVTWDIATISNVTLSNGNLAATNTVASTQTNQGAHVVSTSGKTSGKYYFEVTMTTFLGGGNYGCGIGTTASIYTNMGNTGTTGDMIFRTGNIYASGVTGVSLGPRADGDVIGIAVDLDTLKIWFRVAPSGNWNNAAIGSQNPAVGSQVGGITVPAGTVVPFITFGSTGAGSANNVQTANFGASAFSGAVPAGFTSGWLV